MIIEASLTQSIAIVASDASIKNDIATSISYIYVTNHLLIKTLHHVTFVTSTKAKLFAIRCGINQATSNSNVSKIIVITDSIYAAKRIFDLSSHPFQNQSVAILGDL